MNTENFKPFEYVSDEDSLKTIINLQTELANRYNTFEPNKIYDFDINVYQDQQIFKDFLQIRFIEELTEAMADTQNINHFKEEITDAFNFLVTAYSIYGWGNDLEWHFDASVTPLEISNTSEIKELMWNIVQLVGNTCNHLKNRPWRQSQYLVDLYVFEKDLKEIWVYFNYVLSILGITPREIFEQWSLKYQVNKFRLDSNY